MVTLFIKEVCNMPFQFIRQLVTGRKEVNIFEILLIDLSAILMWRGLWGYMDLYLFPTHPETSFLISVVAGLVLMVVVRFGRW
jgi:hypothetical protein